MLSAGRDNTNWIATNARAAFLLLGRFALAEAYAKIGRYFRLAAQSYVRVWRCAAKRRT
jgi:hypothetical protein